MATLQKKHKNFIVKQLAMFEEPVNIINGVKEKFDIVVSNPQVAYYNPDNQQGKELAQKWSHLFYETRDKFIQGAITIPIAHKQYRLQELQRLYKKDWGKGDTDAAASRLEQAAKEMGDAFNSKAAIAALAEEGGTVNFYTQVNQRIIEMNEKK